MDTPRRRRPAGEKLVLLVFRPNLAERRPAEINPDTDWLSRLLRAIVGFVRPPKTPETVPSDDR